MTNNKKHKPMFKLSQMQKYCQTRVMRCLYFLKIMKRYSPYCPYCTSCGETGCCSPTGCVNHPKGHYCETNQDALKVSYWTLKELWKEFDNKKYPKVEKLIESIYSKNYEEQYEYRKEVNDKSRVSPAKNIQEVEEWCKRQLNRIVNR